MANNDRERCFEEIPIDDKAEYLKNNFSSKMDKLNKNVSCIHCGNIFMLSEYKVVKNKCSNDEFIVCKHFPDCDGTIIDFI